MTEMAAMTETSDRTDRRRLHDRVIWLALALSIAILIAVCVVAVLSYRNPSVPPLTLPAASVR